MKEKFIRLLIVGLFLIPCIFTAQLAAQELDKIVIISPPTPPPGFARHAVTIPKPDPAAGINILPDVPAFNWSFGCSATSAAMIAGYYDRTGYEYMYTGPTNGGVMPMDNSSWPDWFDGTDTRHECPLSATHQGLDGRTIEGHVDDYWILYLDPGPDPFIGNWTEHNYGDCTSDYMKTNQSNYGNVDGSTTFWNYTDGAPLYWYELETYGLENEDGGYGNKQFYESRGYTVANMYNQYIYGHGGNTLGFTYEQYCAEIDAGRPVMIHVTGHTMVGLGYDDADTTNMMYIHDTWDYNTYTMIWGETYAGLQHYGVTIVQLDSEYIALDFGDLEGKPSFLSENGPRHATADLWLGTTYDLELDSRGYENDNPTDDGVNFLGSGPTGGPYSLPYNRFDSEGAIEVTINGNYTHAYVSAWYDQNNNSSFDDPLDNIVNDALVSVPGTYTFTFLMDSLSIGGDDPFRIRVSPVPLGAPGYTGYVYDGEVEDYLMITPVTTAPITFIIDDSQFQEISDCVLRGSWDVDGNYDPNFSSGYPQMYDDGTHGDQIAGDHLWSLQVDLVVDNGANLWNWSALDGDGSWLVENVFEEFTLPDNSPQTLIYVREGYSTPCTGVSWTLDDLVANSGGIVTGSFPDYVTQQTIVVCESDELRIEAGSILRFERGELRVFGNLYALGEPDNMITFTSNQSTPAPSDWFSIHIKSGYGNVENAIIEYSHDGIWCEIGGGAKIDGCRINNIGFAGLFLRDLTSGQYRHNTISNCGNVGFYISDVSFAEIDSNIVFGATTDGMALYNSFPNITYNLIYNNNDEGIDCSSSSPYLLNNTIDNNGLNPVPEGYASAGIECGESSNPDIINNILTNNADHGIHCFGESTPTISYNDVWQHTTSNYQGCSAGTGDISADPLYVDPLTVNYFLQPESPCIDAGDPSSILDPDGTRSDMGAYHYDQSGMHFIPVEPTGRIQPVYIVEAILDGVSLEPGDEIAVLDGDLIVGAKEIVELPMIDPITVYLEYTPPGGDPLPGAQDGNDMLFRVWDRSADREECANISEVITGEPVFSEGTIVALSLEAPCEITQTIGIIPSFLNLISFNVHPVDNSAIAVFDPLPNFIIAQDDNGNVRIPPDIVFPGHPGTNTIDDNGGIIVEKGYNVFISGDTEQTLEVTGLAVDLAETAIPIAPTKLNKIAFPSQIPMTIANVFSAIVNDHVYNDLSTVQDHDGYVFIPPDVVFPGHPGSNTIDDNGGLQPGKGYMLYHYNSEELSFNYPEAGGGAAFAKTRDMVKKDIPIHYTCIKTGEPHALFLKNLNMNLEDGDEFGVFADGKCVGSKRYVDDLNDPLIIWKALPDYDLDGVKEGDHLEVRLWRNNKEIIEIFKLEGDTKFSEKRIFSVIKISTGMKTDGLNLVSDIIPKEMGLRQNYPNPFNPTTTIEISLNKNSNIDLLVYNIRGEVVKRLVSGYYPAGRYLVEWDSKNDHGLQVASGIYFYRMQADAFVEIKKMIFSK